MRDAYLILENGVVFKGLSFGYDAETIGELVFTTGMTGYLETLADPLFYGQIVLQTFPLIGNYGIIPTDFGNGPIHTKAYIVREWCQEPSNFRSEGNLDSFLREMKTPGIYGIDTRALTRILRENGVMNAKVSKTPNLNEQQWAALRGYRIAGAVAACAETKMNSEFGIQHSEYTKDDGRRTIGRESINLKAVSATHGNNNNSEFRIPNSEFNILVWDFGNADKLADGFFARGCAPVIVDYSASADEVLAHKPDGVVLSGGPGDPAENMLIIREIQKLCDKSIPTLGVGLGHQMLALARGAKTTKLLFGHRGANQPVVELSSGQVFVTIQNHGYTVMPDTLPDTAMMSYVNSSDGTCEGINYMDIPAFSIQFNLTDDIVAKFLAIL